MSETVLAAEDLSVTYPGRRRAFLGPPQPFVALEDLSFTLTRGQALGLVGESGSGKSSTARAVMGLEEHVSGKVRILGKDILSLPHAKLQDLRRAFQMVFQDPYGSLDPRQSVHRIVAEPLHGAARSEVRDAVSHSLAAVGLKPEDAAKYPHQFSGGQRQRIAIARAMVTRPRLIVADEPVSALDVSIQAQVLNLMKDIQREYDTSYLFISHDLSVVDYVCSDVMVMFRGRVVEEGKTREVLREAAHPYTRELLAAMPRLGRRRRSRSDRSAVVPPPTAAQEAAGCSYVARCPIAIARCREERPQLRPLGGGRKAACHRA